METSRAPRRSPGSTACPLVSRTSRATSAATASGSPASRRAASALTALRSSLSGRAESYTASCHQIASSSTRRSSVDKPSTSRSCSRQSSTCARP
ncbi:MAG TPA: hypothetical protein VD929_06145 [Caulobacteraceae bacterium]|nr:hypothetical protein [Caulobacteraceae bacterium]